MLTEPIDAHFTESVLSLTSSSTWGSSGARALPDGISPGVLREYFGAQVVSRHVDFAARWLRAQGRGFYTIGSAGHESNAAVALASRPTDPALLHYRSGAFYAARAGQVSGMDPVRDMLRSLVASVHDPISGGRHKVFGHRELAIIPQTSTIGSHLPRAFGIGLTLGLADRGQHVTAWPADAVVVCSFGDASANHSTAVGALNAAAWCAHRGVEMPVLFVCEDNGLGVSVRTPSGWIEQSLSGFPGVGYRQVDGSDAVGVIAGARALVDQVRERRSPAVLHVKTVRLMGHAGSDAESGYRSAAEVRADYALDPLVGTARALIAAGAATAEEIVEEYEQVRATVVGVADEVCDEPRLVTSAQVRAPLTRRAPARVRSAACEVATAVHREGLLPRVGDRLTMAAAINAALVETLSAIATSAVFGEDVSVKGGVYGLTKGLRKKFGASRVFDTLLDEQTILGVANGMAVSGWLPIPEIQYLAYLHHALDQLRGEAATQGFFSNGQYANPMVVRVAGLAYQKGFGGHFHNDNSVAALRDIPGLHLCVPADADEALGLMRECVALARGEGRVCVFLEPIALYHERDLYEQGDGLALGRYEPAADHEPHEHESGLVRARRHGSGNELLMISFGNGVRMSRRVARTLAADGVDVSVLDLRWLSPLPVPDLIRAATQAQRVLIVDETRLSGGVSESVITALVDAGVDTPLRRVTSDDSFIPLGPAADTVLLHEDRIDHAARHLCGLHDVPTKEGSS